MAGVITIGRPPATLDNPFDPPAFSSRTDGNSEVPHVLAVSPPLFTMRFTLRRCA